MTTLAEGTGGCRDSRSGRRHTIVPHTADAGLLVAAPTLSSLFEEAASALASFTADVAPGTPASVWEAVELEAIDLPGLAYGWLNELVTLSDVHRGALVEATVDRIDEPAGSPPDRSWRLTGRIGLRPYASGGARARRQAKSATYHRLEVRHRGRRWTMLAYLDI